MKPAVFKMLGFVTFSLESGLPQEVVAFKMAECGTLHFTRDDGEFRDWNFKRRR
jgi:hypothetical protein